MKVEQLKQFHFAALAGIGLMLGGCAATQTAIEHRNLEATTQMDESVFLEPVGNSQKKIFISIKNTTTEKVNVAQPLAEALKQEGYKVISSPTAAHYLLQAEIKSVGKMSQSASASALGGGYGSALAGAATGAAFGSFGNTNTTIGGGIAGGLIGLAADSLVKNVNYTMITDVQISERLAAGVKVKEQFSANLSSGNASNTHQTYTSDSQYRRYRVRVISTANKVNLSYVQAKPVLEQGLVTKLAGIF